MPNRDEIRNAVFHAIESVNQLSLDPAAVQAADCTVVLGEDAALDSMGFVNFVVALDEEMARISKVPLNVVDLLTSRLRASRKTATVSDLIEFLHEQGGKSKQ